MSAWALVTIGTNEMWAPPKRVLIDISDDLVISNVEPVWWDIHARGEVTRGAWRGHDGWFLMRNWERLPVRDGDRVNFPPGGFSLTAIGYKPVSVEWQQEQRWLGSGEPAQIAAKPGRIRGLLLGSP